VLQPWTVHAGRASMPRVTIGLPVFNGEQFLEQTLRSLLAQDYPDFELIVSDNGSTDGTEAICREYARVDRRMRYERHAANRGAAWNYNRVLALASGKYFKWAACDDLCEPAFLSRCVEVLERERDVVLAYPWTRVIDEAGTLLWEDPYNLDMTERRPHQRLLRLVRNLGGMLDPVFGVTRTDVLRKTRGHGKFLSADYVILAELAMLGRFRAVPEILLSRRVHAKNSRTADTTKDEAAEWFEPGSQRRMYFEYWTVFIEHLRGMAHVPIRPYEKVQCAATFIPTWLWIWRQPLWAELKAPLHLLSAPRRKGKPNHTRAEQGPSLPPEQRLPASAAGTES
jgi:glycosyltransferase involved in cell wall biosynthesis